MSKKRKLDITPSPFLEEHKGEKKRRIETVPNLNTEFLNDLVQAIGTMFFYSNPNIFPENFFDQIVSIYEILLNRALTLGTISQKTAELQAEWLQNRSPDKDMMDDVISMILEAEDRKRREVFLQGISGKSGKESKDSPLYQFSKDPLFDYQNLLTEIFEMSREQEQLPPEGKEIAYGWWAKKPWWNIRQNKLADSMPSRDYADFKRAKFFSLPAKSIFEKSAIENFLVFARQFINSLAIILQAALLTGNVEDPKVTTVREEILFLKNLDIDEIHRQGYLYDLIVETILPNVASLFK